MEDLKTVQDSILNGLWARDQLKPMTEADKAEFLTGAMTTLNAVYATDEEREANKLAAAIPPYWVIACMTGGVSDLVRREPENELEVN